MKRMKIVALIPFILLLLFSCAESDKTFGDEYFKRSIALIELYKIRNNVYPDNLSQIEYCGGYEYMAFEAVKYKKLLNGYELDLVKGWMGFPKDLSYPKEFWQGLGCVKSNLKKF